MDQNNKKNFTEGNPEDERRKREEAILRRKRELLDGFEEFCDARVDLTDDERISDYLRGEMSESEETEFMHRLENDRSLRRKAIAMAYLAKAMKHVGRQRDEELKEALLSTDEYTALDILEKATLKAHGMETVASACYSSAADNANAGNGEGQSASVAAANGEKAHKPAPVSIRLHIRLARPLAIAACVVLLGGAGYKYYKYHTAVSLGEEYCAIFPGHQSPVRGTVSETASREITSLYMNVRRGYDLDATIKRLSVLWEISQMTTYNDYTDEAPFLGWNLAIAYLKNGDKTGAKEVLARLIRTTDKDSLVRINAVNLMKEME